jgi:hypothetical protein
MSDKRRTIKDLEQRIADLKARLPKHSIPPTMLIELEDLQEALEQARSGAAEEKGENG